MMFALDLALAVITIDNVTWFKATVAPIGPAKYAVTIALITP
jgi:hypothetical protein